MVQKNFSFFAMSNNGNIEFCNPMPFSTSFQKFQIMTFYDAENIGTYEITSTTIESQSSIIKEVISQLKSFNRLNICS